MTKKTEGYSYNLAKHYDVLNSNFFKIFFKKPDNKLKLFQTSVKRIKSSDRRYSACKDFYSVIALMYKYNSDDSTPLELVPPAKNFEQYFRLLVYFEIITSTFPYAMKYGFTTTGEMFSNRDKKCHINDTYSIITRSDNISIFNISRDIKYTENELIVSNIDTNYLKMPLLFETTSHGRLIHLLKNSQVKLTHSQQHSQQHSKKDSKKDSKEDSKEVSELDTLKMVETTLFSFTQLVRAREMVKVNSEIPEEILDALIVILDNKCTDIYEFITVASIAIRWASILDLFYSEFKMSARVLVRRIEYDTGYIQVVSTIVDKIINKLNTTVVEDNYKSLAYSVLVLSIPTHKAINEDQMKELLMWESRRIASLMYSTAVERRTSFIMSNHIINIIKYIVNIEDKKINNLLKEMLNNNPSNTDIKRAEVVDRLSWKCNIIASVCVGYLDDDISCLFPLMKPNLYCKKSANAPPMTLQQLPFYKQYLTGYNLHNTISSEFSYDNSDYYIFEREIKHGEGLAWTNLVLSCEEENKMVGSITIENEVYYLTFFGYELPIFGNKKDYLLFEGKDKEGKIFVVLTTTGQVQLNIRKINSSFYFKFLLLPNNNENELFKNKWYRINKNAGEFMWGTNRGYMRLQDYMTHSHDTDMYLFPHYYFQGEDPETSVIAFYRNTETNQFVLLQKNEKYILSRDQLLLGERHPQKV
eukprot:GHVR01013558.1.p2 GENE.GHVR01013558.1~~GHVR01013558.1.p2  ORF type:complete len:700 (+),score=140.46 GHVR01013558.1:2136-4235(+)